MTRLCYGYGLRLMGEVEIEAEDNFRLMLKWGWGLKKLWKDEQTYRWTKNQTEKIVTTLVTIYLGACATSLLRKKTICFFEVGLWEQSSNKSSCSQILDPSSSSVLGRSSKALKPPSYFADIILEWAENAVGYRLDGT